MQRLPTYWLLLASERGARILEGTRPFRDLRPVDGDPVAGWLAQTVPLTVPPAVAGNRAFAVEALARCLADGLEQAGRARRFDRLVMAAPSPLLHEIHTCLGAAARARLRAKTARDLTRVPLADLPPAILGLLRF